MAQICEITGKQAQTGNSRSHSNIASKRRFKVNLHKKKVLNPATSRFMTVKISTSGMKLLNKWDREGKQYDLRDFVTKI
ncbi:MAG: 50S ribosomal protein L28 [Patescibacteria group bacterium]|jgi:large subunit ribosomal protein L28